MRWILPMVITLIFFTINEANAATVSITAFPERVPMNGSTTVEFCASTVNEPPLTIRRVVLFMPNDYKGIAEVPASKLPKLNAGECATWIVPDDFEPMSRATSLAKQYQIIDKNGDITLGESRSTWYVGVVHSENKYNFVAVPFFVESFYVNPESPLGSIVLMVASVGALAAFIGIRKLNLKRF